MRPILAPLAAAGLLAYTVPAEARAWNFKVYLDDAQIGRHTFVQDRRDGELRLVSLARFEVRILFLSAFSYDHRADERWRGGCLAGLDARTVTNGTVQEVRLAPRAGRMQLVRPAGREEHGGCLKTFAYWDPAILAEPRLLNAQTGELTAVKATFVGNEERWVRGRLVDTRRHRLTGTRLSIDLWYAGDEWVALESATDGGRLLRYELERDLP